MGRVLVISHSRAHVLGIGGTTLIVFGATDFLFETMVCVDSLRERAQGRFAHHRQPVAQFRASEHLEPDPSGDQPARRSLAYLGVGTRRASGSRRATSG